MTESDPNCMEDIKLSAGGGDEDSQTSECKGKEQLQSEVDTVQTQEFEQPGLLEDVGPTLERDRRGDGAAQHQAVTSWLQDSQPDYRRAHNSHSTVTLNSVGDSIRDSSSGGDDGDGYSMTSTRSDHLPLARMTYRSWRTESRLPHESYPQYRLHHQDLSPQPLPDFVLRQLQDLHQPLLHLRAP